MLTIRKITGFLLTLTFLVLLTGYTSRAEAIGDLKNSQVTEPVFAEGIASKAVIGTSEIAAKSRAEQAVEEPAWAEDPFSLLFHQFYLDSNGIKVHHQSDRAAMGEKMRKALEKTPVHVNLEKGGLFEREYYGLTRNNYSKYLYYGDLKNNRPSGFGVLTVEEVDPDNLETFWALVYAGNFKTGRYDGYGAEFALQYQEFENSSAMELLLQCIQTGEMPADEESYMPAIIYLSSYVTADGDWSQGKLNGKVNAFQAQMNRSLQGNFWGDICYPDFYVTSAKRGVQTGDTKYYKSGVLRYDGAMKAFYENGTGTSYYKTGKKEYVGKWLHGKYNGNGKLYDEDGKLIYSGKWKNGDYAS